MMTRFWYLSRQYLKSYFSIMVIIGAIVFIVEGIDRFALLRGHGADVMTSLTYVGLRIPNNLYNFFPLIFLIAALSFFLNLSRHSELVALRAAGVSATRIVLVPAIMTLFLSFLILFPYHQLMVGARVLEGELFNTVVGRPNDTIRTVQNGIWIREAAENESRFIYIDKVVWKQKTFENIEVFISRKDEPRQHIIAKTGELKDHSWILNDTIIISNSEGKRAEEQQVSLDTQLDFDEIFSIYTNPKLVQLTDMPEFISRLERDGYNTAPARTLFMSELTTPLFYVFLCVLGSIFALAPMRGGGTSKRVLFALGAGFGFYFLTRLTESTAKAGNLPIIIGVLAIPLSGLMFSIALLLHREDE